MENLSKWFEIRFKQLAKYWIDIWGKSAKLNNSVGFDFQSRFSGTKNSFELLWATRKVALRNISCLFYILLEYNLLMQVLKNKLNGIYSQVELKKKWWMGAACDDRKTETNSWHCDSNQKWNNAIITYDTCRKFWDGKNDDSQNIWVVRIFISKHR